MKTVKFKMAKDPEQLCKTKCKFQTCQIGSTACQRCPHNKGIDWEKLTINCEMYNKLA